MYQVSKINTNYQSYTQIFWKYAVMPGLVMQTHTDTEATQLGSTQAYTPLGALQYQMDTGGVRLTLPKAWAFGENTVSKN